MNSIEIFGIQFALSLVAFSIIAKWHIAPILAGKPVNIALGFLILPHAFRHIGMTFLTPAVVSPSMPGFFATTAGYGDLTAGLLAIIALIALRHSWGMAIAIVWVFNIIGTLDLMNALRQAEAVPHFGAAWFIPTFLVPALIVTHIMIYMRLLKREVFLCWTFIIYH